ncbi:uncharacterized protein LOC133038971 [Cannabis sativa]|uniref:uncharacterized protein LOC133038971 n=1 Tax=Cannabis sativa TaxID=3483 RepID=UPI0029C9D32B|nr:uncharacterized protein LOC133038971 [Cannabis sativa]
MDSSVFVLVPYDGVWTLEGFEPVLHEELEVDPLVFELKLEVLYMYMKGTKFPPEVLVKDSQLRVFLSMKAKMSVDNLLPLFVTKVKKNVNLERDSQKYEFDAPFYNNDPVVDLGVDDDVAADVPPLRMELTPSNQWYAFGEIYLGKLYKNKEELKNVVDIRSPARRPWVIGHIIKNKYTSDGSNYKAKDIQRDMFDEYGIKMSYEKAWRCREKAVMYKRGTPAESYTKLYGYFYMPERIIHIDGTFLKTKYGGTLLVAVAYDANNQLFPVAFAIVDSENHDSWKYFLRKLKEAIGPVENLMFISDRHQSIEHAVDVVFPEACHSYAWNKTECDRHFEVLKQMYPAIATYVEQIGFEKWARPYCPGDRYNIMTSNAAESFNKVTEEFRKYPVTILVDFIRFTLQNWFASRLEKASKCATPLATTFENDLKDQHKDGMFRSVLRNGAQLFNVGTSPQGERGGDVNLVERTCTCGLFQMLKIPCPHACAAAVSQNVSVYTLCSPYYTKETWKKTYDATINIVGEEDEWVLPEHIKNIRIGVPVEKKPVGRPRKSNAGRRPTKRRPSSGQVVVEPRHCSLCHGSGHNRATCKARV